MNTNNIIAVIPARGGSKGIPGKNIKVLAGRPLIYYSIKAAQDSKYVSEVFVSTDSDQIADVSISHGARVVKRPDEFAKDDSPTIDSVFHTVESIKSEYDPSIIVLLQPTSPLRDSDDIDMSIELFFANKCMPVVSMCEVEHSPYWYFKFHNGHFEPLFAGHLKNRRQDLPRIYRPNGAIYISSLNDLYKNHGFYSDDIIPYIMPTDKSVDIDTEIDFKFADLLIQERDHENRK